MNVNAKSTRWLVNDLALKADIREKSRIFQVGSGSSSNECAVISLKGSTTDAFTFETRIDGSNNASADIWIPYKRGLILPKLDMQVSGFNQLRFNEGGTYKIIPSGAISPNCIVEFKEYDNGIDNEENQPFAMIAEAMGLVKKKVTHDLLRDPLTGLSVVAIMTTDENTGATTVVFLNKNGTPYLGNSETLVEVPDIDVESDQQEFCDNGVSFLRWFVKKDGVVYSFYDTLMDGATSYAASPNAIIGSCLDVCQSTAPVGVINTWG